MGTAPGNSMKKALFALLPLLLMCGCVMVPYGYGLRKDPYHGGEKVIGERRDAEGNVVEKVIRRNMEMYVCAVGFSAEGFCARGGFYYSRYVLDTPAGRKSIWQISHFPMLSTDVIDDAVPIEGSGRWLLRKSRLRHDNSDEADLRLVLYSPAEGVVWDKTFRHCRYRNYVTEGPWSLVDGGRAITVHFADGGEKRLKLASDPVTDDAIAW